jgi:ribonuclease BN (tRNA processing enzyme)
VELIVLGAGPAYTDRPGASGASYLVQSDGVAVLVDLGQGSFPRIFPELEPSRLAAVLVSHLHPDHFVDLVALRHYLRYEFMPPRRIAVHADAALAARLDGLHGQPGFTAEALDVVALAPGVREVGPLRVEAARVTHTADSYAFRLSANGGGSGLVYSGDVGRAEDLVPLIRPGDALLVEASFGAGPVEPAAQHLNGPAVGTLAAATGAGRVLLTHLQMGHDVDETVASVRAAYGGPVVFVEPGYRTEI